MIPKQRASELQLIDYIRKRFPHKRHEVRISIGDDAMVMKNGTVVSTDSFAEGVHFDLRYFTKYDLGYRTMAGSLSDLAAMAAKPVCALVSLYLPKNTTRGEIAELYKGFYAAGRNFRLEISGGDIIESPFWGVTITVIGITKKPLLRSGAKPGQVLSATNFLGLAEVGRLALLNHLNKREFPKAVEKHLYPRPRISESLKLKRFATACIDTSDGLSTDAFHISEESKVKVVIEPCMLPVHPEVALYCRWRKIDPVKFILSAGEDFELLFTADKVPVNIGFSVNRVGRIEKGRGLFIQTNRGLRPIRPSGFEHLKQG
ncbi:MAG TPA: thiamine-phosphate kinase [bacterium]